MNLVKTKELRADVNLIIYYLECKKRYHVSRNGKENYNIDLKNKLADKFGNDINMVFLFFLFFYFF